MRNVKQGDLQRAVHSRFSLQEYALRFQSCFLSMYHKHKRLSPLTPLPCPPIRCHFSELLIRRPQRKHPELEEARPTLPKCYHYF